MHKHTVCTGVQSGVAARWTILILKNRVIKDICDVAEGLRQDPLRPIPVLFGNVTKICSCYIPPTRKRSVAV